MLKSKGLRMKGLPGDYFETVIYKLLVLCEGCSLNDLVASIHGIIEKRMSDVLHVRPYLMGTACLQFTFNQRNITQVAQQLIMGNRVPAHVSGRESYRYPSVFQAPAHIYIDRSERW